MSDRKFALHDSSLDTFAAAIDRIKSRQKVLKKLQVQKGVSVDSQQVQERATAKSGYNGVFNTATTNGRNLSPRSRIADVQYLVAEYENRQRDARSEINDLKQTVADRDEALKNLRIKDDLLKDQLCRDLTEQKLKIQKLEQINARLSKKLEVKMKDEQKQKYQLDDRTKIKNKMLMV